MSVLDLEPVPIMYIFTEKKRRNLVNDYVNIDKIFLHPEVIYRKVVIVTVVGAFRRGKSFLLDYCLRFLYANYRSVYNQTERTPTDDWMGNPDQPLKGFSWKAGSEADTKGIIVWPDVFLYDTSDEKLAIVLMDTQGLFENNSSSQENSRIFSLSTLIASSQIINIPSLIQEDHIEYLSTATSLSQMVHQKGTNTFNVKLFQKITFLIRDWFDEQYELGYKGGDRYLNKVLANDLSSQESLKVREHIRESFEEINCCLLPHPGLIVNRANYDGRHGVLEEVFVVELKSFIESILKPSNLIKKLILGKEITGQQLRDYIYAYFEAFSSKDIPKVESILEMTIEKQIKGIIDECIQLFHQEIKNSTIDFNLENKDKFTQSLLNIHNNAKQKAITKFRNFNTIKSAKVDHGEILTTKIDEYLKDWKDDNESRFLQILVLRRELEVKKLSGQELQRQLDDAYERNKRESRERAEEREKDMEALKNEKERIEALRRELEIKKSSGQELQRQLDDAYKKNEQESRERTKERAKDMEALKNEKERIEALTRQIEELKQTGVFGYFGDHVDNACFLVGRAFKNLFYGKE